MQVLENKHMLHITLYGCFLSRSEILDMAALLLRNELVFDYKHKTAEFCSQKDLA